MPELPEVQLVVDDLKTIEGYTIESISLSDRIKLSHRQGKMAVVKHENLQQFEQSLIGQKINTIERRGKYIVMQLTNPINDKVIIAHLGMSGRFEINTNRVSSIPHTHTTFELNYETDTVYLHYIDPRRFGELRVLDHINEFKPFQQMAPEPFDIEGEAYFIDRFKQFKLNRSTISIKQFIMDAQNVVGCGNIYANEALFICRIHPLRKVHVLTERKMRELYKEIVKLFIKSIERGGSSIHSYVHMDGEIGSMQDEFLIYQKQLCPICQKKVTSRRINQRNSFYCTNCQK